MSKVCSSCYGEISNREVLEGDELCADCLGYVGVDHAAPGADHTVELFRDEDEGITWTREPPKFKKYPKEVGV